MNKQPAIGLILTCAVLWAAGCGDGDDPGAQTTQPPSSTATAEATSSRSAADVSCPYEAEQVSSVLGSAVEPIATDGDNDVCSFGTPGSSYPIDSTQPFVTVSTQGEYNCRFEDLDAGLLPTEGGYEPVPEWGDGAWKVVLPSSETRGDGAEGSGYLEIRGGCVEIFVDHQGETVETVDRLLTELVDLAR